MALAKASIEPGQVQAVRFRKIPKSDQLEYLQNIWVYKLGSRFPTEYQIRLPSGLQFYSEGDYIFDLQANMRPDRYKSLSVDAFAPTVLYPATPEFLKLFDKITEQLYQHYIQLQSR